MSALGDAHVCAACLATASQPALARQQLLRQRQLEIDFMHRFNAAGVPNRFLDKAFAEFQGLSPKAKQIADALRLYCESFTEQRFVRPGFLFTGLPGTGKTHLACAMVQELVVAGFRPRYVSLPNFSQALKESYGDRSLSASAMVNELVDADFLVIDEVDLHGSSVNDYQVLYDIINRRYEKPGYPTLVISNRTVAELVHDLDERLVSRVLGETKAVVFDWESLRRVKASERRARALAVAGDKEELNG